MAEEVRTIGRNLANAGSKGTLSLTATQFLTMVLGYAVQIAAARLLLPAGYGEFTLVISLLFTVEVVVMESPRAYSWALARDPSALPTVARSIRRTLLPASLLLCALFAAGGIPMAALLKDARMARLLAISALHIPFLALMMALRLSMVGLFQYRAVVISGVGYAVARVACMVAFVLVNRSVEAALWAQVAAGVLGAAMSYGLMRPLLAARACLRDTAPASSGLPRTGGLPADAIGRFGFWFMAAGVLGLAAGSVDLWLLKGLGGSAILVGLYSVGYALSKAVVQVSAGLSTGIFPVVSRCAGEGDWEKGRRILAEGNRLLLVAALPCVVIAAVCSRALLTLFFSAAYGGAERLTQVLLASGWAAAFAGVVQAGIGAAGRPRACALINAAVLAEAVGLNAVLIPRWGVLGAATAALAAALSLGAASLAVGSLLFGNILPWRSLLRGAAASAASGALAWALSWEGWLVLPSMILALCAAALAFYATGGVSLEDRRTLRGLAEWLLDRKSQA